MPFGSRKVHYVNYFGGDCQRKHTKAKDTVLMPSRNARFCRLSGRAGQRLRRPRRAATTATGRTRLQPLRRPE